MSSTPYSDVANIWRRYWKAYGGCTALVWSPYVHFSVLLTLVCWNTWSRANWWEDPIGVLPDLLGFTLGGLAILLGLFEAKIVNALRDEDLPSDEPSDLQRIIAAFVHFIVVQSVALTAAFVCKSLYLPVDHVKPIVDLQACIGAKSIFIMGLIVWGGCYFLFLYAIVLVLATTMAVFRLSKMLETIQLHEVDLTDPEVVQTKDPKTHHRQDSHNGI